jgi:hypothetical protein
VAKRKHRVEIDGVIYVPASDAQIAKLKPASVATSRAVAIKILTAYWLHGSELRGRGAGGFVFDALRLVAPGAAEMLDDGEHDAADVLKKCFPEAIEE